MKVALDVHYDEDSRVAVSAAVIFERWDDVCEVREYTVSCNDVESYIPGQFFRRELPCLLAVLERVQEPLDCILIDGYVWLGQRPGLGARLWQAIDEATPVVGVAKSPFRGSPAVEILRGKSKTPLYITSAGIELREAASNIEKMAGNFRIPTLLRRADTLARMGQANER